MTRIRLGLGRVRVVLGAMGHPEDGFASVLVAGTNGKGSVCAMTESVLRAAGYRTGLFTSPHLVGETERIRVSGRRIAAGRLADLRRAVRKSAARLGVGLTNFEEQTIAAFLHFCESGVEIAVVEVGLGGRLDATNALPAPEVTAVTSIGRDHLGWLGPRPADVFYEKSGIMRPGTPHLQAVSLALARQGTAFHLESAGNVYSLGKDFSGETVSVDWRRRSQAVNVRTPWSRYAGLGVPLLGPHQAVNAATAACILDSLRGRGWKILETQLRAGFSRTRWPGRFEVIRGRPPLIVDGGHNAEAVERFAAAYRASPWGGRTAAVVFGCLKDKPAGEMVERLAPLAHLALTVPLPTARSRSAAAVGAPWAKLVPTVVCASFRDAWRRLEGTTSPVVVIGSLYLVGETYKTLKVEQWLN